jgi:hypothetical protein
VTNPNCFLDALLKGKTASSADNCDCPCRHYWVTKCTITGVEEKCKQLYKEEKCTPVPIIKPMKIKVTECRKCEQFYETVLDVTVAK